MTSGNFHINTQKDKKKKNLKTGFRGIFYKKCLVLIILIILIPTLLAVLYFTVVKKDQKSDNQVTPKSNSSEVIQNIEGNSISEDFKKKSVVVYSEKQEVLTNKNENDYTTQDLQDIYYLAIYNYSVGAYSSASSYLSIIYKAINSGKKFVLPEGVDESYSLDNLRSKITEKEMGIGDEEN